MTIEPLGSLYTEYKENAAIASVSRTAVAESGKIRKGFAETLADAQAQTEVATAEKSPPPKKAGIDKTDALYEQCEALETFLVKNLLNSMRSTVQKSGFIQEGFAGKMYEDMLYDVYATDFTKQADFGLAELAYRELTGSQRR
jgi:flagellar protein FlgJ